MLCALPARIVPPSAATFMPFYGHLKRLIQRFLGTFMPPVWFSSLAGACS